MNVRKLLIPLFVIAMLLFSLAIAASRELQGAPQIVVPPGSAARGAQLFKEKECLRCHSFQGRGGKTAPDLAQRSERASTPALLASLMWNHSPAMWAAAGKTSRPILTSSDTSDLFAYFYSQLYFSIPGDAARGKVVFEEKNCASCHTARSGQNSKGPLIGKWAKVNDPITWAERMWNHASKMYISMARSGLSWPAMSPQNMVDLMIYIRSLPEARSQAATFQPGEPELGRVVFEDKCELCHTFGSKLPGKRDLLDKPAPGTLTDYIAAMWNHPTMLRRPTQDFPALAPGDMKDLVAYLFAQRHFLEKGDVNRGANVYREKNCVRCHEQRRKEFGAPDLTQQSEVFTPVTMAAAVWRHGPAMLDAMKRERLSWPEFHGSEMTDLLAYLNSRLVPLMAAPRKP
jgi:cytochrome c2